MKYISYIALSTTSHLYPVFLAKKLSKEHTWKSIVGKHFIYFRFI